MPRPNSQPSIGPVRVAIPRPSAQTAQTTGKPADPKALTAPAPAAVSGVTGIVE